MPELPEVEAARALIEHHLKGFSISKALVPQDEKVIQGISSEELENTLTKLTVGSVVRKAKYLWLEFGQQSPALMLHFGMTGSIIIRSAGGALIAAKYERVEPDVSGAWPPKYSKLVLEMSNGACLAFTDPRRFGRVRWLTTSPLAACPLDRLAPDAMNEMPSLEQFKAGIQALSRKRSLKIKALLLDQEGLVSGIGNWIADEVLYQAQVHPEQAVISMSPLQIEAVYLAIKKVVGHAVSVGSDATLFPRAWLFHYRWTGKKAGVDSNGMAIEFVTVGSRTSAFVPALQKVTLDVLEPAKATAQPAKTKPPKAHRKKVGGKAELLFLDADDDAEHAAKGKRKKVGGKAELLLSDADGDAEHAAKGKARAGHGGKRGAHKLEQEQPEESKLQGQGKRKAGSRQVAESGSAATHSAAGSEEQGPGPARSTKKARVRKGA